LDERPTTERGQRNLPQSLSSLRQKLNQKAKAEPKFRFYALYDKVYRMDFLEAAWKQVKENGGAAGIDGVTIEMVEERGVEAFLTELQEELKNRRYKPDPVRRIYIPKTDGRKRPLGIPTVRDRVAQMSVLLVIEPIFEADFLDCSYGFRPGRSAHDALKEIDKNLKKGLREIYDADLRGYFDSIAHDKLMACLEKRISDRRVLSLIRKWLKAPVIEPGKPPKPPKGGEGKGTPQGGVISPLLANAFLHWFDHVFHCPRGPGQWAGAKLVRYADDFVIMARYITPRIERWVEETVEDWMGLELNGEKTKIVRIGDGETLDFLGYSFVQRRSHYRGKPPYIRMEPSRKTLMREREALRERTCSKRCLVPIPRVIEELNRHLRGWKNYFSLGYSSSAHHHVDYFVRMRLEKHLKRRSQKRYKPPKEVSLYKHFDDLGLIWLRTPTGN